MSGIGATLLQQARHRAGLSKRALAERAGVAATTVARIEDGTSDPTVTMLERLLTAAGSRLEAAAVNDDTAPPTIAALATAISSDDTGRERIDWTRLRGLTDYVVQHPGNVDAVLESPPARTNTILDAILAALAEQLADETNTARPGWARIVGGPAEEWATPATPLRLAQFRSETTEPFARRNLVLARSALFHDR